MDLEEDAVVNVTNKDMEELTTLCQSMKKKMARISELAEMAKDIDGEVRELSEKKIPALMDMMGVESIGLKTGESVTKKSDWKMGESEPKRPARIEFLREHDEGILKNEVSANFGKGDDEKAEEFYGWAQSKCENVEQKIGFNMGSFKALLRELEEQGVEIPKDKIGAFKFQKTVIKEKKKKG